MPLSPGADGNSQPCPRESECWDVVAGVVLESTEVRGPPSG